MLGVLVKKSSIETVECDNTDVTNKNKQGEGWE